MESVSFVFLLVCRVAGSCCCKRRRRLCVDASVCATCENRGFFFDGPFFPLLAWRDVGGRRRRGSEGEVNTNPDTVEKSIIARKYPAATAA